MCGIPGAENDFATAAHGLRVGRHHTDGTKVVQDVFCCDSLGANTGLGEGDIFRDVLAQMVADH
jgi:hypothetical protein